MKSVATTGTPVPLNFYRINSLEMGTGRGGGGVVVVQGRGDETGTTRITLHTNNNNLVIKTEPNKCAFILPSENSAAWGSNKQGL